MKLSLSSLAAAASAFVLSLSSLRAAEVWETNFEKAKATAAKENRDLLLDFTGSDWCAWCIRLHEEVFEKTAFKQEAPKHFVLVELDFPQAKEQSEELKKQNEKLQKMFKIEGFPTILLLDSKGRPYARTGYEKGGAAKYLEHLAGLRKLRETRDESFKKAAAAEGAEKAKLFMEALGGMEPDVIHTFYEEEVEQAIAADKEDASGAKKSRDEFKSEVEFRAKVEKLEEELAQLHDAKKLTEFAARIDKFISDEKLTGRRKQDIMMAKLATLEQDLDGASRLLDEVIAVDPKSDMATNAKDLQKRIKDMKKQQAGEKEGGKEAKEKGEAPEQK